MIYDIEGTPSSVFPDITKMEIEPDGLIAIGGDLSVQRILTAYSQGVCSFWRERTGPEAK